MNIRRRVSSSIRILLLICLTTLTLIVIFGCGGGFDGDSNNTRQFQQSIFGTDTLE